MLFYGRKCMALNALSLSLRFDLFNQQVSFENNHDMGRFAFVMKFVKNLTRARDLLIASCANVLAYVTARLLFCLVLTDDSLASQLCHCVPCRNVLKTTIYNFFLEIYVL